MSPTAPSRLFWLGLLAVFWAFYGLAGRDAWKAEEAIALAPVLDWLAVGASAWQAPAPLHVVASGLLAKAFQSWLSLQDGARLASGVFSLVALLFTGLAARSLFGPGFAQAAVLAMLGTLGLMLRMHAQAPETALLAVWSMLLAGVAGARNSLQLGGILIGLALAALTLGLRGLPDLAAGLAIVLLPLLSRDWRQPTYRRALALGLWLTLLLVVAALVYLDAGGQLLGWLRWHGLSRFTLEASSTRAYSEFLWFAWPLWPLALAALWHEHRRLARATELHLPLLALLVSLFAALAPTWSRDGGLLPMLPALALLAAYALETLKRGAAQAFYWFGVVCFLFFVFAFWLYFVALEWGLPARLAAHVASLTPSYRPGSVATSRLLLALLATSLWLVAIPLFPRAKIRPVLVWASGMVLAWILLISLFRPWAEAGWAYRPLIADLARHLPPGSCLKIETDPAMRIMLRYHLDPVQDSACPWLLTTENRSDDLDAPLWEGARPRYKQQRYRLYHSTP